MQGKSSPAVKSTWKSEQLSIQIKGDKKMFVWKAGLWIRLWANNRTRIPAGFLDQWNVWTNSMKIKGKKPRIRFFGHKPDPKPWWKVELRIRIRLREGAGGSGSAFLNGWVRN